LVGGAGAVVIADLGATRDAFSARTMISDRAAFVVGAGILVVVHEFASRAWIAGIVGAWIAVITGDRRTDTASRIAMIPAGAGVVVGAGVAIVRRIGAFASIQVASIVGA